MSDSHLVRKVGEEVRQQLANAVAVHRETHRQRNVIFEREVQVDKLTEALAPLFACGLALQHLIELLDPILSKLLVNPLKKKAAANIASLIIGAAFTTSTDFNVFKALGVTSTATDGWLGVVVTVLMVSAGTDSLNSLVKFLYYKKEEQKGVDPGALNQGGASFPLSFAGSPVAPL